MASLTEIQHPRALRARTVAVDVFGISQRIRTRVAIAPDQIETFSEVVKHHVTDPHEIDELFAALERGQPKPTPRALEYRWKVVAYDASGARIAELYASAIAPFGMTGSGLHFTFVNEEFIHYLAAHYGGVPAGQNSA